MNLLSFLAVVLGLMFFWESARWVLLVGALLIAGVIFCVYRSTERAKEDAQTLERQNQDHAISLETHALILINRHRVALARKAGQTIYKDDYGTYVYDKWLTECNYFIDRVLVVEIPMLLSFVDREWLRDAVSDEAETIDEGGASPLISLPDGMSSIEFEHYCAELLRRAGWEARVTTATGDQGIDIVGVFSGVKVVFQCKLYSSPVGNSAVQEVIAGQKYEGADLAAVISNSTYTPAARRLAATASVHLLHFSEVPDFTNSMLPASQQTMP